MEIETNQNERLELETELPLYTLREHRRKKRVVFVHSSS